MATIASSTTEQPMFPLAEEAPLSVPVWTTVVRVRANKRLMPKRTKVSKPSAPSATSPSNKEDEKKNLATRAGKEEKSLEAPQKSSSEGTHGWEVAQAAVGYQEEFWSSVEEFEIVRKKALKEQAKREARQLRQQLLAAVIRPSADAWVEAKSRRKERRDAVPSPPLTPVSEVSKGANGSPTRTKPSRPSQKKRRKAAVRALEAKAASLEELAPVPLLAEAQEPKAQEPEAQSDTDSHAATDDMSVAETCCEDPDGSAPCDGFKVFVTEPEDADAKTGPPAAAHERSGKQKQQRSGASKKKRRKQQKAAQEVKGTPGGSLKGGLLVIAGLIIGGAFLGYATV